MPRDEWTKTIASGETVHYTYVFEPDAGGVITATKGAVTQTTNIHAPMTRQQVEAEFLNI